jgi:hypothetical protein
MYGLKPVPFKLTHYLPSGAIESCISNVLEQCIDGANGVGVW